MLFVCNRLPAAAAALLLFSFAPRPITSSTITAAPPQATQPPSNTTATCEFRTINYITDSLPQLCFRSSWSHSNGTASTKSLENATVASAGPEGSVITVHASQEAGQEASESVISSDIVQGEVPAATTNTPSEALQTATPSADELEPSELNEASFLSFEEWKKQALEKAGQSNPNIGNKKSGTGENRKRDSESIQNNLDSIGDEGEIDLDFGAFRDGEKAQESSSKTETTRTDTKDELPEAEKTLKRKDHYRSSDAGITCKERFSYASFDAGATVLKTHSGAKNPKAVLIENKDSYMLSECSTGNKFIIIELSEDIWIDTVVLANYEFFSSMVRTFRVSVSDRYPVKMEKWKDAGTYEARNSREIQAFLVENPQIWARYIRIEFLSHYGNEYYCPLSLVRVHGTRMLESWKETEAIGEDEDAEESEEDTPEEHFVPDAVADALQQEQKLNAELRAQAEKLVKDAHDLARENRTATEAASKERMITPWVRPGFQLLEQVSPYKLDVCFPADEPTQGVHAHEKRGSQAAVSTEPKPSFDRSSPPDNTSSSTSPPPAKVQPDVRVLENITAPATQDLPHVASNSTESVTASETASPSVSSQPTKVQNSTGTHKNKTTTTSSASASLPTIQESFFKAVSRRLQLLESNSTLSLKYIEEQSKILREAFSKVEKKQLQKSTSFLDTLNNTVLTELRGFRQQYDEIWQSTVISLESQREESRKEILAISSRLNILADEVVFQKRMSIVQSVLLLLCLGLVIFSRVSASGPLDFPSMHSRTRHISDYQIESPLQSPPESPEFRRDRSWLEPGHLRQQSGGSGISRSRSRDEDAPPTPISTYSRSDAGPTPPSGADDAIPHLFNSSPDYLEPTLPATPKERSRSSTINGSGTPLSNQTNTNLGPRSRSSTFEGHSGPLLSPSAQGSPARTPQKRRVSMRQQSNPPLSRVGSLDYIEPITDVDGVMDSSPKLKSSPKTERKPSFSIARKPLPALPNNST